MADKSKGIKFNEIQMAQVRQDAKRAFLAIMVVSVVIAIITLIEGNGFGTIALRIFAMIPAMLAQTTLDFYERAFEGSFARVLQLLKLLILAYIGFIIVQIPTLINGWGF